MSSLMRPQTRILVASAAAYTVAFAASWLQPVLIGEILHFPGMTDASAGLVLTAEMLALAFSATIFSRLLGRIPFVQVAAAGTLLAIAGNALSMMTASYGGLLLCRLVCGIGEGAAMMVSNAAPARAADPERAYANINATNILIGALMMAITPVVGHWSGGQMTYPTLLGCMLFLFPLILIMPRSERLDRVTTAPLAQVGAQIPGVMPILAVAVILLTLMGAAIWSFSFVLGMQASLDEGQINLAMTVSIGMALVGTLIAGLIGTRIGRFAPLAIGGTALAASCFYLSHPADPNVYRIAMAAYMLSLYFVIPYLFGFAANLDPSGRGAAMIGAMFLLALAIGPYLGGLMVHYFGYGMMGIAAIASCAIALLILSLVVGRSPPPQDIVARAS